MNWIDKILPVISLIFGFGLSEFGKYFSDRKNERKKLKKLLFNLLELRWLLKQEIDLKENINEYVKKLKIRLAKEFGEEMAEGVEYFKPVMMEILKNSLIKPKRITEIEDNIDSTISELSEIYPIFAYELTGKFKIKEKLDNTEKHFGTMNKEVEKFGEIQEIEEFSSKIKNWIEPRISTELISEFDEYIIAIAKKIGRKTNNNVSEKLKPISKIENNSELDNFIDDYIIEIKKTMPNTV